MQALEVFARCLNQQDVSGREPDGSEPLVKGDFVAANSENDRAVPSTKVQLLERAPRDA